MSKPYRVIYVTPAQVEAARMIVERYRQRSWRQKLFGCYDRPRPSKAVRKIANAKKEA